MGYGIVRADSFTFTAFDTFVLVYIGLAVDHGDSTFGADFVAGMRHTPHASVGYFIFIDRAGIAGGRNHLHQRRFIIFLGNIALFQSLGHMHRNILRAQAQSHCQTKLLTDNRPFPINTFPINRFRMVHNLIGQRFHIVNQVFRMIRKGRDFLKYTSPDFSDLCLNSSHTLLHHKVQSLCSYSIFT